MTFCCAAKAFKILTQKYDQIWRKVWRCFVGKKNKKYATSEIDCHFCPPNCHPNRHFCPPKRHVENRDFVDFCAKSFAFVFENVRYKIYLSLNFGAILSV